MSNLDKMLDLPGGTDDSYFSMGEETLGEKGRGGGGWIR